jgi:hypothetical protein
MNRNCTSSLLIVMAGLDPAIHDFLCVRHDVDARVRPGHDGVWFSQRIPG